MTSSLTRPQRGVFWMCPEVVPGVSQLWLALTSTSSWSLSSQACVHAPGGVWWKGQEGPLPVQVPSSLFMEARSWLDLSPVPGLTHTPARELTPKPGP